MIRAPRRGAIRRGFVGVVAWLALAACRQEVALVPTPAGSASARASVSAKSHAPAHDAAASEPLREVVMSGLELSDFADDELDFPYYLAHFSTVANSIAIEGPERGQIKLSVWRGSSEPQNARVLENALSLAWFFTQKRSWNPYYGQPSLRVRLEAVLDFWCRSQAADGQFSEYERGVFGLAPTAFATKFFGEALLLLRAGPAIDARIMARAEETLGKAVRATLTLPALYATGSSFTNQFGNVWGGGLAFLSFHPDTTLRTLWEQRFQQSRRDFQSPAGFYYESDGPDFEYSLNTHAHSVRQAWEWLRGTALGEELLEREQAWFDWLSLNALPEPRGGFVLNAALSTRKTLSNFVSYDTPLAEFIPAVRAYAQSVEELTTSRTEQRARLAASWPHVEPLSVGEFAAYSPYVFLHRRLREWRPTSAQRDAARRELPMLRRSSFTLQRSDSRRAAIFTYVRRPSYYAALATGERASEQQRYGMTLFWLPGLGVALVSQPATQHSAWGTRAAGRPVYEAGTLNALFTSQGLAVPAAEPGGRELATRPLTVTYPLSTQGRKTITFEAASIRVAVRHAGEFDEILPLLVPVDGKLEVGSGRIRLVTPRGTFTMVFGAKASASVTPTPDAILDKRLRVVVLHARDRLDYSLAAESGVGPEATQALPAETR